MKKVLAPHMNISASETSVKLNFEGCRAGMQ